ncbi:hypothetical protein EVAR_41430_1 [Eumeta japonica]|uniref:Uncharacterized protein n=1 Tax=Eumeta variegata TaxID=151549 RepID=A0A4C1W7J6_EUMVA|nr:hypothetical protein EVAR_41430_1 [Eumeta japonica]
MFAEIITKDYCTRWMLALPENIFRTCPRQFYRIWRGQISVPGIGSSRLDCGDEDPYPSHLFPRTSITQTRKVQFGTLNVCGGMNDENDDVSELMKNRRLDFYA